MGGPGILRYLTFFILGLFSNIVFGQTDSKGRYGLEFSANFITYYENGKVNNYHHAYNERTRLIIPNERLIEIRDDFSVSFDFYIWQPKRFGTILTVYGKNNKILLELVYSSVANTDTSFISIVESRQNELARIPLLINKLGRLQWSGLSVFFFQGKNEIELKVKGKSFARKLSNTYSEGLRFVFGRAAEGECPALGLRDIRIISVDRLLHYYPLDEVSGSVVHDNKGNADGFQEFGEWIAPKHFSWESYATLTYKKWENAISVIDTVNGSIDYFNQDYSAHYFPDSRKQGMSVYNNRREIKLNFGYLDHSRNKMYAVFGSPGDVSEFNFAKRTWTPVRESVEKEWRYFNAGILHDSEEDEIYRFGGYGWYTTNNKLFRYDKIKKVWEDIVYEGDFIEPRMVIYTGIGPKQGTFWMFYGRGNSDGDQRKGWHEFYDLYLMDVRNRRLTKYWSLPEKGIGQIVHNSRYIAWGEDYKTIFLFAGAHEVPYFEDIHVVAAGQGMQRPEVVGDHLRNYRQRDSIGHSSILLSSNKKSLFVSLATVRNEKLVLLVKRIYLPHYTKEEFEAVKSKYAAAAKGNWLLLFIPVGFGLILAGLIWRFRNRFVYVPEDKENLRSAHIKSPDGTESEILLPEYDVTHPDRPGIYLLGDLHIINHEGINITDELKGKTRELFLQIVLFKYLKGKPLSYQFVHETLWSDFDDTRRNNNRKVTMSTLRKSLESFPQIEIETNDHTFSLNTGQVYTDLAESIVLYKKLEKSEPDRMLRERVLQMLEKGKLLKTSSYEWLDPFVEQYNNLALEALDKISTGANEESSDMLLRLGQLYFEFDQFSETGLQLKIKGYIKGKKPHLAAKEYKTFCAKYEKYFAEGFGIDLEELARNQLKFSRD